ncbi:MAG TPA: RNA polymerase sigma-70 factor [Chitinophaga sp.]
MRPFEAFSDAALLELFQSGNMQAYEEVYRRYWSLLYISACKILREEDEAKDIVQEIFLSFLNNGRSLTLTTSLSAYLYTAVRYKVLDRIKHLQVKDQHFASLAQYAEAAQALTDGRLLEKELIEKMEQAIRLLPDKMRVVFELSRRESLSHKEIARLLQISDKTVKKQIANALKVLKVKLVEVIILLLFLHY